MMTITQRPGTMREVIVTETARRLAARDFAITICPDEDDGGYIAETAEYPFFAGDGDTPDAAEAMLREAIALAIAGDLLDGRTVPEPYAIRNRGV